MVKMNNGQHNYNNWQKMRNVAYTVKASFVSNKMYCFVSQKDGKDQESIHSSTRILMGKSIFC